MEKLAIKGGYPVRTSKIYYGRQWVDEDDIAAVSDVLRGDLMSLNPSFANIREQDTVLLSTAEHLLFIVHVLRPVSERVMKSSQRPSLLRHRQTVRFTVAPVLYSRISIPRHTISIPRA